MEELGRIIGEYFDGISPDAPFNLTVDEFLFDDFLEELKGSKGIPSGRVYSALGEVRCDFRGNKYMALAIASYQVVLFYRLGPDTSSNAYVQKISSSEAYEGLRGDDYWYGGRHTKAPADGEAYQEKLWALLKRSFRIKDIPEAKRWGDNDRYVQYPKSQNIFGEQPRTYRIKFADEFKRLGLEPNMGIRYEQFTKLVFRESRVSEFIKRIVFSFYCVWDGRSSDEIERKAAASTREREKKAKDKFRIELAPTPAFYMNGALVDHRQGRIPTYYLWKFGGSPAHIIRRGRHFIQDEDYKDWLPAGTQYIDPEEESLLLTEQNENDLPSGIKKAIGSGEIELLPAGRFSILILGFHDRKEYERLGPPVRPEPVFRLVGGLKARRNAYYPFALPAVQMTEDYREAYRSIFIDSREYPLEDGLCRIPEERLEARLRIPPCPAFPQHNGDRG